MSSNIYTLEAGISCSIKPGKSTQENTLIK